MVEIVSDMVDFDKKFPDCPKSGERRVALEHYLKVGGVVKVFSSEKDWPKLAYPNNFVLEKKLKELREKKNLYEKKFGSWNKQYSSASKYHQMHQIKKLKEPLYWKHMAKMTVDPDYRKDADAVGMPIHLVADDKWKPMIKMFVKDYDYRKQLSETVRNSIVYKKDKKVAKYADELKDFRMNTSNKQMVDLQKKIDILKETESSLKEMQKWAKE